MVTHPWSEHKVLDIIQRYAPRQYRTKRGSPRNRYSMPCPLPTHNDAERPGHEGSFSVNESEELWQCFGCGGKGNAYQLYKALSGTQDAPYTPYTVHSPSHAGKQPKKRRAKTEAPQGGTLAQLTAAKGLDPDYVRDYLTWEDVNNPYHNALPAVEIPYYDAAGEYHRSRYRVGLDKGARFIWDKRANGVIPYGLHLREWIKSFGYVIFVEGETDTATLLQHNIPAIGLAGATQFNASVADHFREMPEVYVWQEPDDAGQGLAETVAGFFPAAKIILPPPGCKDPTEVKLQVGAARFPAAMDNLRAQAQTYSESLLGNLPPIFRTWFQILKDSYKHSVLPHGTKFGNLVDSYLARGKQALIEALESEQKHEQASHVRLCYDNYRILRCRNTAIETAHRFHCGYRLCPIDIVLRLGKLFDEKGATLALLVDPTVYAVRVGTQRIDGDVEGGIRDAYTQISKGLSRLADKSRRPGDWDRHIASNHISGVRCHAIGDAYTFEVLLLGERNPDNLKLLEQHFAGEMGGEVTVEDLGCHGRQSAISAMTNLMSSPFIWETPGQYWAWHQATFRRKLIQGRGMLYRASGGMSMPKTKIVLGPDGEPLVTVSRCRVCGSCDPEYLGMCSQAQLGDLNPISRESEYTKSRVLEVEYGSRTHSGT